MVLLLIPVAKDRFGFDLARVARLPEIDGGVTAYGEGSGCFRLHLTGAVRRIARTISTAGAEYTNVARWCDATVWL